MDKNILKKYSEKVKSTVEESKKDRKKLIKNIIIIGAIILTAGYGINKANIFETTEVKVVRVEKGQLSDLNLYTGMITPGGVTPIYMDSTAIVENVLVRVGEEIEVGTELMTFSNQSVVENEKALRLNELDIKDLELQIADQESGTMKLELDNRLLEIRSLEEQINTDAKKLPNLEKEAKVFAQLLKEDGVSVIEARAKEQAYEELKVSLDLNREKYNLMVVGYESLKRELDITMAKLNSSLEKLKIQNEALKNSNKQLKEPFVSPVKGIITGIDVAPGNSVAPGQRVVSVAMPGESRVVFEVPTYQVSSIKKGQDAFVISREESGQKKYKGIVEKVSSSAVSSQYSSGKVISVEVVVTEENNLRPGFIADVEISGQSKSDVPMINSFSVMEENGEYYVFINEKGKAKKQKINVGARTASGYEVTDLPIGTQVIVNPFKVRNGEKIRVVD